MLCYCYLFLIAHGDLHEHHWGKRETLSFSRFKIYDTSTYRDMLDLLKPDLETPQTENKHIHTLDKEEHDARID